MTPSDHPSRDRVLDALRAADEPLRLTEVCARVGLSPNAARRHLGWLADDGLARVDHEPPRGPGRPAALYSAIPVERDDSGEAYRTLAGLLGRALSAVGDDAATGAAGRDWARRVVAQRERTGAPRPGDATEVVYDLFAEGGFTPRLVGDEVIELHGCPFLTLAVEQPEVVCAVHLGLIRGVLDEYDDPRTARLAPVLDGSGPCVLRLGGRGLRPPHRTGSLDLPEEAVS